MIKSRPNFNIVDFVPSDVDYETFKEDYLNPKIRVEELRKMHSMSRAEYREFRNRVKAETGIKKKPVEYVRYKGKTNKIIADTTHIEEKDNGFILKKQVGSEHKYFGRYKNLETAKMVRDKLIDCDWDDAVADELREKYANKRRKPSKVKAVELFPLYEFYYFQRCDLSVKEILEKLRISSRVYTQLTKMMRQKHGENLRRWRTPK